MTPYRAQRIRFGILAARHEGERWRMTEDHADFVEACESVGWAIKHSKAAYDHEWKNIGKRDLKRGWLYVQL